MHLYAIPFKLKAFRESKGITQEKIAKMLNMEQTTYGKKERGKSSMSLQTIFSISKIIEKKPEEFVDNASVINHITESTLHNIRVSGDVIYNNCSTSIPDKIIAALEDIITIIKTNYKI